MAIPKPSVRLICWKPERAVEIAAELNEAGFEVQTGAIDAKGLRALGKSPPDAVVIDLGRLPSQGRDVGVGLRTTARSRRTPLIFVDGAEEKIARTKQVLPDAVYTPRAGIGSAVQRAIAETPTNPVVPESNLAGYSGTPLPKKLGIKPGSTISLVAAPEGFGETLGRLPDGATAVHGADGKAHVTLWFLTSLSDLHGEIDRMAEIAGDGRLWICWPKKTSGVVTDVTQNEVRSTGLAAGLVDFKICAVDATWSGLCFTHRKN